MKPGINLNRRPVDRLGRLRNRIVVMLLLFVVVFPLLVRSDYNQTGLVSISSQTEMQPQDMNTKYTEAEEERGSYDATWYGNHTYRKAHVIQQTAGAGINHTVPLEVYLGSGTSSGNATYLDWKAMAGLTDVRFTDENHSVLEYWLEEYYCSGTPTDYFTDTVNVFGIHDRIYPPAVFYNDRTYIAHHGEGMNPMITYYDHENATWSPEIEIAQSPLVDDTHGPPAMWIDNSGYIHVLYGAHGTPLPHVVSIYPNRIDAWTAKPSIGTTCSYPTVAYDATNDVVHLWTRQFPAGNCTLTYTNSTDGGDSWSTEQHVVNMEYAQSWAYKGTGGVDHLNPEIVHICWASYNQTRGTGYYEDIRYVYLNTTTGLVYNVTGHSQGYEVTSQEFDDVIAWDSNEEHVYGPTMKVPSDSSEPYFVVQTLEAGGRYSTMVFWNSTTSSWEGEYSITSTTTNWGGASDFVIYAKDNISAFLTNGTGDIGHWNWDGGSWSFVEWVYNTSMGRDEYMIYTNVPVGQNTWNNGHNETLRVIATEYNGWLGKHIKMFAWGTEGLVQRTPITGAKFWVKIPTNLSAADFTLYIYYGEPDVWSVGEWFPTTASPTVTHGSWNATEYLTVTNTTSGYDVTSFYETLQSDYMLFPDNETHGYYFAEDGADLSDWTYTDLAPTTDDDVMSLHVVGDSAFDYFVCNDTSMPAGYYYLEHYTRANVTSTSYYWVSVWSEDGAQGTSTTIDDFYFETTWLHRKMGIWIDHAIESIMISAKAAVSDTKFDIDWIRFTNETGWQHDGSSTYGVTTSGAGSVSSDGDYISLISSGGWGGFSFIIDPTATRTMLDPYLYPFLYIDFHPDDSDDWYYLHVYDDSGLHVVYQSLDNWAIDIYYNIAQANPSEINYVHITFSGARTIRIDSMKLYSIANFTLQKNIVSPFGSLHVEDGALVSNNSLNNWMILEYDVNPAMNLDYTQYGSIEMKRSSANHSLYFSYYTGQWSRYDRAQIIEGSSTKNILNFRIRVSNAGAVYSIRFGSLPRGPGNAPVNVQSPICSNLDDSTYLYGRLRDYQLVMYASDPDGHDNIRQMELTLVSDDRVTEYWTVRYDGAHDIFSERADPFDYITLNMVSSTHNGAGNDSIVTFLVSINWNHPALVDADIRCYVVDDESYSDNDYYEVDWDVETRLELPGGPMLADSSGTPNRGDIDGDILASGSVVYHRSGLHAPASEIDVYVVSQDVSAGPWRAANYEESTGTFSVVVSADDEVGQDAYRFKVVLKDDGADGTDLLDRVYTRNYIADCIVGILSEDESASNETTVYFLISLTYAYDGAMINDFMAVIENNGVEWFVVNSSSFTDERDIMTEHTYAIVSVNESMHGLTSLQQPLSPFVIGGDGLDNSTGSMVNTSPEIILDSLFKISTLMRDFTLFLWRFVFPVYDSLAYVLYALVLLLVQWSNEGILTLLFVISASVFVISHSRRYTKFRAIQRRKVMLRSRGGLKVYNLLPMNGKRADLRMVIEGAEMSYLILDSDGKEAPKHLRFMLAAGERPKRLLKLFSSPMGEGQGNLSLLGLIWET